MIEHGTSKIHEHKQKCTRNKLTENYAEIIGFMILRILLVFYGLSPEVRKVDLLCR